MLSRNWFPNSQSAMSGICQKPGGGGAMFSRPEKLYVSFGVVAVVAVVVVGVGFMGKRLLVLVVVGVL